MIFAEVTNEGSAWVSIISTVVNLGFSAVVGWYLLTKALPKMQDDFRMALAEQQKAFDSRDDRRRTEGKESLVLFVAHCEKEAERHDESFRTEMGIVNATLRDVGDGLEELRNAVRDWKAKG